MNALLGIANTTEEHEEPPYRSEKAYIRSSRAYDEQEQEETE